MSTVDTDHANLVQLFGFFDLFVDTSGDASEPSLTRDILSTMLVLKVIDVLAPVLSIVVFVSICQIKDAS